jgi:intein/homing endonuclease
MGIINSVLTEEQKEEVVRLYNEGMSTPKLAKKYGIWTNAISGILKRRGIIFRNLSLCHRKYDINETFFDNIDTEEKAYVLGLFYADGSNNIRRYKAYISLQEQDKDILEKIRKLISPTKPLLFQDRKTKNPKHSNTYMFYIDNKHISIQLEKLGCVTNKTNVLTFPLWLDKNLYSHFIRGYFDGDGHIGVYDSHINFDITSTDSFCHKISNIFLDLGVETKFYCRHPLTNKNIITVRVRYKKDVIKILNWMYKNATIFMNRKFLYISSKKFKNALKANYNGNTNAGKPVRQIINNKHKDFKTIHEASLSTGILKTSISNMLNGRSKSAGGYIWKKI